MSQHDAVLDNAAGSALRADLNNALQALISNSSGATAPSTTYAHMVWFDTTTNTKKRRNSTNAAWISEGTLSESFLLARSSNTILGINDRFPRGIHATASFTQTLDAVATLGDGWMCPYIIDAGATVTFDPNASENIDGATTKVVGGPASGFIWCNGAAFFTIGFAVASQLAPAFFAYNSADDANQTGNGTVVTVDFDTEVFDVGGNFSGDTFTAPVAGKYLLTALVRFSSTTTAMSAFSLELVATGRTYSNVKNVNVESAGDLVTMEITALVDMAAGDTAIVQAKISNGVGDTATIKGGATALTYFTGVRVG